MQVSLLTLCCLLWLQLSGAPLYGAAPADPFISMAQSKSLAQDEVWHRVLFYERHSLVRGVHGLIDDPLFYLAEDGKTDPAAELNATLRGYFQDQDPKEPDLHALCRFPARLYYLEQR